MHEGSNFSTSTPALVILHFYYNHQRGGKWYLVVVLICILPSIFSGAYWPSTYLLWGSAFEVFLLFPLAFL